MFTATLYVKRCLFNDLQMGGDKQWTVVLGVHGTNDSLWLYSPIEVPAGTEMKVSWNPTD